MNSKPKSGISSDKENEKVKKEMARIDAMELSDIDLPEFALAKQDYLNFSRKRQTEVEEVEKAKRKASPLILSV